MEHERRVVCAGGAVVDRKFHLAVPSVAGTSNPAAVSTSSGGVARNIAENLAGLLSGHDIAVELVSAVGDDEAGAMLLAHLGARQVGVRNVLVLPGEATAQYVAVLEPGGDLTIGIAAMAVLDRVDVAALDAAWPADGGWLFCDTNLGAPVLGHAVRTARATGVRLVVDAVSTLKVVRLPADLRGVTLFSCNRDEARAWLTEHARPAGGTDGELAARVRSAGAEAVLLTRGADGVVVADASGVHDLPAVPAEVVDVTGAGDALVAGTLAALVLASSPSPDSPPPLTSPDLLKAVTSGIHLAARTVASRDSVLPQPHPQ